MSVVLPSVAALSKTTHKFTDMEVADQWRREWAGTAEYGKVTEGGVTRRIARAMEVLHASGPGSRVRVMRAAYHSSAGPGAPAESFMLHSSRRVISSGFNFLESPSLPTKPLEISSTPLELIHDSNGETENYKVTEPDDTEISEPSKWRGSTKGSSIRMPSEESSSTDNASIIDLDARNNRNVHRKYSYDSESSDIQCRSRSSSRNSHLLDAPTALSTLKYKSLLNNSNEWNTRRKSYSFEDTSPLNETVIHSNDTLAMESSTDSGICKSTEVMNEHLDDNSHIKYFTKADSSTDHKEGSFREWLSKNRQNSQYRGTKFKTYREHPIVIEDSKENNIALKSPGKVSITLPVTIEMDSDSNSRKLQMSDDERRIKKVEFCKTEVHFAAESGKVNIIATDEKPPPSNDFRKRRSAFVPIRDMIDRPITLFGEKPDFSISNGIETTLNITNGDFNESDENTAATKSILKNKIPKPKPYLLGENMDFGLSDDVSNKNTNNSVLTAVSLVNQQLESEKRYKNEIETTFSKEAENNVINNHVFRTINAGPIHYDNLKHEKQVVTNIKIENPKVITGDIKNKLNSLQSSPVLAKPKTRQLRESDLTYFGIDDRKTKHKEQLENKFKRDNISDDEFRSVKLIQQISSSVSNSVCNSEPESEDAPEYQNLPLNINFAPVPKPRLRSKYDDKFNEINEVRARLKPITEKESDEAKDSLKLISRRAKVRRHEELKPSRSHSEPPKNFKLNSIAINRRADKPSSPNKCHPIESSKKDFIKSPANDIKSSSEDIPIYANLKTDIDKLTQENEKNRKVSVSPPQRKTHKTSHARNKHEKNPESPTPNYDSSQRLKDRSASSTDKSQQKHALSKDTLSSSLKREATSTRTEKTHKSQHDKDTQRKKNNDVKTKDAQKSRESKHKIDESHSIEKKEHREHKSRQLQRALPKSIPDEQGTGGRDHSKTNRDTSSHRKRNSSKDKTNSLRENIKPSSKVDSNYSPLSTITKKSNEKELDSRPSSHRSNKHREYVINYDDKNGTVSSICKIKPGLGTPRRKKTSKEVLKENYKNNDLKIKSFDKIALRNAVRRSSRESEGTDLRR